MFHGYWAISPISLYLKRGSSLANLLRGFIYYSYNFWLTSRLVVSWIWNSENLLRISSEVYSISKWHERLTDTIIEVEELSWGSGSSGGRCLIVKVGFCSLRSDKEDSGEKSCELGRRSKRISPRGNEQVNCGELRSVMDVHWIFTPG